MRKKRNFKILMFLLISVLFVSIGYASIADIGLTIGGSAHATASSGDIGVKFSSLASDINVTSTCLSSTGTTTNCITVNNISVIDDRNASFNISNLEGYGDTAIVSFKILNEAGSATAALSVTASAVTNSEYFSINSELSKSTITAGDYAILTIEIKVKKVLTSGSNLSSNVTVTVNASQV